MLADTLVFLRPRALIGRHGIYPQRRNILSPALEELLAKCMYMYLLAYLFRFASLIYSHTSCIEVIARKFYTWHDSCAVLAYMCKILYYIMTGRAFVAAKEVFIMETVAFWPCDNG